MTHADLIATLGRTPLVELRRLAKGLPGRVLAKLEMRNPCGNVRPVPARSERCLLHRYSVLRAVIGSTRPARRAGR
jgi:hypothetical protein